MISNPVYSVTGMIPSVFRFYCLLLLIPFYPATLHGEETGMVPELRRLVVFTLNNNLELQSLAEEAAALYQEVPLAGALDNPQLTVGLANLPLDSFDLDQEAMTQKQVLISQKIPWFGKLQIKEKIALLDVRKKQLIYRAGQLEVIKKLSMVWYDLALTDYSLHINKQLTGNITQMLRVAETRYGTGKGLQQDILAAQVQLSKLIDEKATLSGKKEELLATLNEIINSAEPYSGTLFPVGTGGFQKIADRGESVASGFNNNPALLIRRVEREKAALLVALAEKNYGTDMNFRFGYGQRDEDPVSGRDRADFFSASVTLSVPLWRKSRQDSQLVAALKRQRSALKRVESYTTALRHRFAGVLSAINTAQQSHDLFTNALILQADQLAEASLAAYSVGKIDFNTMLGARLQTLRYQLQAEKYRYLALKKRSELAELMGEPVSLLLEVELVSDGSVPKKAAEKSLGEMEVGS